ncbi:pali-domain-containing protein [Mycena maculata]|uniref:Pali-domain-containing protein n=1 Tax=Mycena maculata TaxID=230809 RepID=A0AAD7HSP4_9AGAR|nr:pali-domain-containing protein [Mycena maculata]
MSPRSFYLAGIALLGVAFALGLLVSISLPFLSAIDFVRVTAANAPKSSEVTSQIRFGIWAPCEYDGNGERTCLFSGHGYSLPITSFDLKQTVIIGSSYTRGLAIHPVALVFTAVALGAACVKSDRGPVIATLTSFVAAFLTVIAFICDIALYAFVKQQIGKLDNSGNLSTTASFAFWMTFVWLIMLLLSGCTVCFGRRRDVGAGSYPAFSSGEGILARFRKG